MMRSDRRSTTAERPLVVAQLMGRLSPSGGVQIVVRRLASGSDPSKVELHIVTMRPAWDDLSDLPVRVHPGGFGGSRLRLWDRISITLRQAREVRRIRPDVVQMHSGMAWLGIVARVVAPRTPFLLEVHDAPGSKRHSPSTDRFEGWLVRWAGVTAVCHSTQVEDALMSVSHVPARSIVKFPLGVDTVQFRPVDRSTRAAWRCERGISEDAVVAIAIARPAPLKRFDLVIAAVAAVREQGVPVELVLIGPEEGGPLRSTAVEHRIGDAVHIPGPTYGDELALAIGSCDILCSASEYEGFGLTMAEGMACGLPVIATSVGGVPDVVADGVTGHLVPVGDEAAFAARLHELASSSEVRAALGLAGRERAVEHFSIQAMARSFERLFRSVTHDGARSPSSGGGP